MSRPLQRGDQAKLDAGAPKIRDAEREARESRAVRLDGKLPSVVKEITRLHGEILAAAKMSLEKAIKIGELLSRVRASRKGKWLAWIKDSVPFSDQTARNYIGVYERRDDPKFKNVLNLSDAYALLCPPKTAGNDNKPKRQTRLSQAVEEYVRKGIATDEKAARRILAKRSEQPGDATTDEKAELQHEAPVEPQPKGWQPDVLNESDLTHEERQAIKPLRAYLASPSSGRAKVVLRFVCEKLGSEL